MPRKHASTASQRDTSSTPCAQRPLDPHPCLSHLDALSVTHGAPTEHACDRHRHVASALFDHVRERDISRCRHTPAHSHSRTRTCAHMHTHIDALAATWPMVVSRYGACSGDPSNHAAVVLSFVRPSSLAIDRTRPAPRRTHPLTHSLSLSLSHSLTAIWLRRLAMTARRQSRLQRRLPRRLHQYHRLHH
jgi:hypothetical protein